MFASDFLEDGHVYTRAELRELFSITDATLNNGVFWNRDFNSVWLFVTEEKQNDRTPYTDHLDGGVLYWEGQTKGRTDAWIIEHGKRGLEVLLFYRKEKYEFEGAGFRYCGRFRYVSHENTQPTRFRLEGEAGIRHGTVNSAPLTRTPGLLPDAVPESSAVRQ